MSLFLQTAPPPQSLVVKDAGGGGDDGGQLVSLKEDLLTKLESIEPRIENLPNIFSRVLSIRENRGAPTSAAIMGDLAEIQSHTSGIHKTAIAISRRVQGVSLNSQTAATLAVPRSIKPVRDEFYAFKEDFDSSLQNIAILIRNLNNKHSQIVKSFDPLRRVQESLPSAVSQVEKLVSRLKKYDEQVQNLQTTSFARLEESFAKNTASFDEKLTEAETLVAKLSKQTDDGLSDTIAKGQQLQTQKFDITTSFHSLSDSIAETSENQAQALHTMIDKSQARAMSAIEEIQQDLSFQLDTLADDAAAARQYALIDEIAQEKEIAQLESLIARMSDVSEQLRQLPQDQQKTDTPPEEFTSEVDGVKTTYLCYPDGTFTTTCD